MLLLTLEEAKLALGNTCHFYTCPYRPEGDQRIHFVQCSRLTSDSIVTSIWVLNGLDHKNPKEHSEVPGRQLVRGGDRSGALKSLCRSAKLKGSGSLSLMSPREGQSSLGTPSFLPWDTALQICPSLLQCSGMWKFFTSEKGFKFLPCCRHWGL